MCGRQALEAYRRDEGNMSRHWIAGPKHPALAFFLDHCSCVTPSLQLIDNIQIEVVHSSD